MLSFYSARSEDKAADLKIAIFSVPWGYLISGGSPQSGHLDISQDGIKLVEPSTFYPKGEIYDASELIGYGLMKPTKGAQAFYLQDAHTLYVKDTKENIDLLLSIPDGDGGPPPTDLRNEIFVVELGPGMKSLDQPVPSLPELRKAAGQSWKQISALDVTSKSGVTGLAQSISGKAQPLEVSPGVNAKIIAPEIGSADSGASAAVQSCVGPDSYTIDSVVSFHYQNLSAKKPVSLVFSGESSLEDGMPVLLQYVAGGPAEPSYAIIERVTLVRPDSFRLNIKKPAKLRP